MKVCFRQAEIYDPPISYSFLRFHPPISYGFCDLTLRFHTVFCDLTLRFHTVFLVFILRYCYICSVNQNVTHYDRTYCNTGVGKMEK